uniref:Peptidyl-prolyl cis-trans isomerase n=1 Tax=Aquila chrysaetos chrysaetos TaxID=223781 RepID=A0A663DVS7_AQUCH
NTISDPVESCKKRTELQPPPSSRTKTDPQNPAGEAFASRGGGKRGGPGQAAPGQGRRPPPGPPGRTRRRGAPHSPHAGAAPGLRGGACARPRRFRRASGAGGGPAPSCPPEGSRGAASRQRALGLGPASAGTGKGGNSIWGKKFEDEFSEYLKHSVRGVVSMANNGPNTNGSQFFITYGKQPHLDMKYTVFGKVIDGLETLDELEKLPVNEKTYRPLNDVRIKDITIHANPFAL